MISHSLSIALGNISWRLLFKTEESANVALMKIQGQTDSARIEIADDFGQKFTSRIGLLHGFMLEDLDQTKMAHAELMLHQARAQALATKMAQSEPDLRRPPTSPAILNPMGNGFGPPR